GDDVEKESTRASQDLGRAGEAMIDRGNGPQRTGNTIILPNSYEKEDFVLSDMRRIFGARIELLMDEFNKKYSKLEEEAAVVGNEPDCRTGRPKAATLHKQFVPLFNDTWTQLRKEVNDYQGFAGPWLADVHDPKMNALENASSEVWMRTIEGP